MKENDYEDSIGEEYTGSDDEDVLDDKSFDKEDSEFSFGLSSDAVINNYSMNGELPFDRKFNTLLKSTYKDVRHITGDLVSSISNLQKKVEQLESKQIELQLSGLSVKPKDHHTQNNNNNNQQGISLSKKDLKILNNQVLSYLTSFESYKKVEKMVDSLLKQYDYIDSDKLELHLEPSLEYFEKQIQTLKTQHYSQSMALDTFNILLKQLTASNNEGLEHNSKRLTQAFTDMGALKHEIEQDIENRCANIIVLFSKEIHDAERSFDSLKRAVTEVHKAVFEKGGEKPAEGLGGINNDNSNNTNLASINDRISDITERFEAEFAKRPYLNTQFLENTVGFLLEKKTKAITEQYNEKFNHIMDTTSHMTRNVKTMFDVLEKSLADLEKSNKLEDLPCSEKDEKDRVNHLEKRLDTAINEFSQTKSEIYSAIAKLTLFEKQITKVETAALKLDTNSLENTDDVRLNLQQLYDGFKKDNEENDTKIQALQTKLMEMEAAFTKSVMEMNSRYEIHINNLSTDFEAKLKKQENLTEQYMKKAEEAMQYAAMHEQQITEKLQQDVKTMMQQQLQKTVDEAIACTMKTVDTNVQKECQQSLQQMGKVIDDIRKDILDNKAQQQSVQKERLISHREELLNLIKAPSSQSNSTCTQSSKLLQQPFAINQANNCTSNQDYNITNYCYNYNNSNNNNNNQNYTSSLNNVGNNTILTKEQRQAANTLHEKLFSIVNMPHVSEEGYLTPRTIASRSSKKGTEEEEEYDDEDLDSSFLNDYNNYAKTLEKLIDSRPTTATSN